MLRTHTCGQLRSSDIGQEVTLCGWVDKSRDHGGTIFLDLRDRFGKTQVVVNPDSGAKYLQVAKDFRGEDWKAKSTRSWLLAKLRFTLRKSNC